MSEGAVEAIRVKPRDLHRPEFPAWAEKIAELRAALAPFAEQICAVREALEGTGIARVLRDAQARHREG